MTATNQLTTTVAKVFARHGESTGHASQAINRVTRSVVLEKIQSGKSLPFKLPVRQQLFAHPCRPGRTLGEMTSLLLASTAGLDFVRASRRCWACPIKPLRIDWRVMGWERSPLT
jgi:hypothetical protein